MVHITDLTVKYDAGITALQGVSFTVKEGEKTALIGANGAGKSTLLLALAGILTPSLGEIRIAGIKAEKKTFSKLRKKVGMIFQNPENQLFMPEVYEDIVFGVRGDKVAQDEIRQRASEVMENLQISHLQHRMTHMLSGGEKRLAALAGVLVMQPSVILMDEPSSFLDPKSRRRLIEILKGRAETMLIATHDLDLALDVCERVILLKNGEIAADGRSCELLWEEALLLECGLELPLSLSRRVCR